MKTLKGLTFAPLNKTSQDPVLARRAKLVQRLQEQRALALDPSYVRTVQRWMPNDRGEKELVELKKRVRPWWREDVLGTIALIVRAGTRPIEFEKGKAAIIVPSKEQLVATIETVIAAARAGELDEYLVHRATTESAKNKRAA